MERTWVLVLVLAACLVARVSAESAEEDGSEVVEFRWWKAAVVATLSLVALGIGAVLLVAAWYKQLKKDKEEQILEAIINDWDEATFSDWVNM